MFAESLIFTFIADSNSWKQDKFFGLSVAVADNSKK